MARRSELRKQSRDPVDIQQERDFKRQRAVEQAVNMADRIIFEASDGSVAETDYLTSWVAQKFAEKLHGRIAARMLTKDLEDRRKPL